MGCSGSCSASRAVPPSRSRYTLDRRLGSGASGVVYRGVEKTTNHVVAIKTLPNVGPERIAIESEIDMMRRISKHPNIIDFVDAYETPVSMHLVLEYMWGGELFNILPRSGLHSEEDAAGYVKAMASALCHLHRNCVAHRDLKPKNLMLTSALGGELKVCDFASAKVLPTEDTPMRSPCGTWAYAAPEVLWLRVASEGSYTLKCDLFPVGVILYFLLVGYHPFDPYGTRTAEEMYDNICHGVWEFDRDHWYGVSPQARSVVTALLEVDPVKRLTAKQLRNHAWTRGSVELVGQLPNCISSTLKQSYERTSLKINGKEPYQIHAAGPKSAASPERHEHVRSVGKATPQEESSIEASMVDLEGYPEEGQFSTILDAVSAKSLALQNTGTGNNNASTADGEKFGQQQAKNAFQKTKSIAKGMRSGVPHGKEPYQAHAAGSRSAAGPERHEHVRIVGKASPQEESSVEASTSDLAGCLEEGQFSTIVDASSAKTLAPNNTGTGNNNTSRADVQSKNTLRNTTPIAKGKRNVVVAKKRACSEASKRKSGKPKAAPKLEVQQCRGDNGPEKSLSTSAPPIMQTGNGKSGNSETARKFGIQQSRGDIDQDWSLSPTAPPIMQTAQHIAPVQKFRTEPRTARICKNPQAPTPNGQWRGDKLEW